MSEIPIMYEHFYRNEPGLENSKDDTSALFSVIVGHKPSHPALFVVDGIANSTRQSIHIEPWQYNYSTKKYSGGRSGQFQNKSKPIKELDKAILVLMLEWIKRTPVWISLKDKSLGHKYFFRFALNGKLITAKVVGPNVADMEVFTVAIEKTKLVIQTFYEDDKLPEGKVLIPGSKPGNTIFFRRGKFKKNKV